MVDGKLSEEQINNLLNDAENRLKTKWDAEKHQNSTQFLNRSVLSIAPTKSIEPYIDGTKSAPKVHMSRLVSDEKKKSANEIRKVVDPIMIKKKQDEEKSATTGPDWYNLPRTKLTPELKRDLQILHLRDVLDPKRHYKKDKMRNKFPEYSQVGTIIEGPTEYLTGRLTKKQRKRTLVEEILNVENATGKFKKKYNEIQLSKTSGKKAHYKKVKRMRSKMTSYES